MDDIIYPYIPFDILTLAPGEVFFSRFSRYIPTGSGHRTPPNVPE
jgi:hypothetical protein